MHTTDIRGAINRVTHTHYTWKDMLVPVVKLSIADHMPQTLVPMTQPATNPWSGAGGGGFLSNGTKFGKIKKFCGWTVVRMT